MNRARRVWRRMGIMICLLTMAAALGGCALFNQAPTAVIVADPLEGESPLTVSFDGSDSFDPEGPIASYRWTFDDQNATSEQATDHHTFLALTQAETYTVTLRVTDEAGATSTATQSIEVRPPQGGGGGTGEPIVRITADRIVGRTPLTVTFSAADTQPGSGSITQIRSDFADGTAGATGMTAFHTFTPDRTREFKVTAFVGNTEGLMSAAQITIIVIVPEGVTDGEDPTASVEVGDPLLLYESPNPAATPTLYEVSFDPRGSYADAGHSIEYFAWDFGDGVWRVETEDAAVTHVYSLAVPSRTYVVRLYVYDDQGLEDVAVLNLSLAQPVDEG